MNAPRRVALVTGASSGIGAATATLLARDFDTIVLSGRDEARLAAVAELVRTAGAQPVTAAAELSTDDGIAAVVAAATAATGRVDALVHSAGIYATGSLEETPRATLDELLAINVTAPFLLTRAVLPAMAAGGTVIFVASISGHVGFANEAGYAASKGAVEALVRALAMELSPRDIAVNAVAPGFTETPMNAAYRAKEGALAGTIGAVPAGRLGTPRDIAAAVAFLASSEARFVRGVCLPVDGGYPAAAIQQGGTAGDLGQVTA